MHPPPRTNWKFTICPVPLEFSRFLFLSSILSFALAVLDSLARFQRTCPLRRPLGPPRGAPNRTLLLAFSRFFSKPFVGEILGSPLKRRLSRAFGPQGPPKDAPREARGTPSRPLGALGAQLVVVFRVCVLSADFARFSFSFFCFFVLGGYFSTPARLPKGPLGPPKPPRRAPWEAPRHPEAPRRHTRRPQSTPREPQARPKSTPSATQGASRAP